jgi:hypothetical protein
MDVENLHYDWDENRRSEALQEDVGGGLEECIRDEENRKSCIILARCVHVQVLRKPHDLGIANICSIQEGEKIEGAEPRDQNQIEFPEQLAVLGDSGYVLEEEGLDALYLR